MQKTKEIIRRELEENCPISQIEIRVLGRDGKFLEIHDFDGLLEDMREFELHGLFLAIDSMKDKNRRAFAKKAEGKMHDLIMQAQVNSLTNAYTQSYNRVEIMYVSFLAGLDVVLDYLDDVNRKESTRINQLPYELPFLAMYAGKYGKDTIDDACNWLHQFYADCNKK